MIDIFAQGQEMHIGEFQKIEDSSLVLIHMFSLLVRSSNIEIDPDIHIVVEQDKVDHFGKKELSLL